MPVRGEERPAPRSTQAGKDKDGREESGDYFSFVRTAYLRTVGFRTVLSVMCDCVEDNSVCV